MNRTKTASLIAITAMLMSNSMAGAEEFIGFMTGYSGPPSYLSEDYAYDNWAECEEKAPLGRCTMLDDDCDGHELWADEPVAAFWVEKLSEGADIEFYEKSTADTVCSY